MRLPATRSPVSEEVVRLLRGPPLAKYLQRKASAAQFGAFVAHRSVYHLEEVDPHGWALVEIQAHEYGGGRVERAHSELFRTTMRSLGSDDTYGHFVDDVPAVTLAVSNLMSLFGMNRRRLGGDPVATRFFDERALSGAA